MQKISVIYFDMTSKKQNQMLKMQIQKEWKVKDFLQNLQKITKRKFLAYKSHKKDQAQLTSLLKDIIQESQVYVSNTDRTVSIIRLQGEKEQILEKQFQLDQKITVQDFEQLFKKQKKINCQVVDKTKKRALKYLPISNYIAGQKILVKTSQISVNIYNVESAEPKLLKTIQIDENSLISDLAKVLSTQYKLDLAILDKDKVSRAPSHLKISKYIQEGKIYVKYLNTKITGFCQQNTKLPKYSFNVDLDETVQQFKNKNKVFETYLIMDKTNAVAQSGLKLSDIVENKGGTYFFKYKELSDQQAHKARMTEMRQSVERLDKINETVKNLAKKNSEEANQQMAAQTKQMQRLMDRLTKNVSNIKEKDFNLQQKIRYVEKSENATFVQRLYKVSELYTTDMLLEQNPGRIYWPFFKNEPFLIRKRIIDFKKSIIQTTNCSQFQDRQSTTHQKATTNKIEKSIQENMSKIQTSAKVGVGTPWVKVSLQTSYSDQKSDMTETENQTMKSDSRQYVIYNALKMTDAYHIDEENIALKESIKKLVKKMYDLYEKQDPSLAIQAVQFYKNYGTHLQIGKYTFGCRYGFVSMAQSHQETSRDKLATVSRAVKSMGIAGSVEGGFGAFSASAGFSVKNTTGSTNSNLSQNQKSTENFSFEIKYKLDGIQVKNRDTWREVSGVYKKGWKLMGIQDVRLVRIVDILKNECNAIYNPSYKKTYDQFLNKLSDIEINMENNYYNINDNGQLDINLKKRQGLSNLERKRTIQATIEYLKSKSKSGTITNENLFEEKLLDFLNQNIKIDNFTWFSNEQTIIVTRNYFDNPTIKERIFQLRIQIRKK